MARLSLSLTILLCFTLLASGIASDHGMCTSPPPEDDPEASCGTKDGSIAAPDPVGSLEQESPAADETPEPLSFFLDISATIDSNLPLWDSSKGWKPESYISLASDMSKGNPCYVSKANLNVHTGTHIDMPSHFLSDEYDKGTFAHLADLESLIGPALVLEVPFLFPGPGGQGVMKVGNITASILRDMLLIEKQDGLERLILKTESSRKGLMRKPSFDSSYVGLTLDAALYIVEHTKIKLIAIDYLSIAANDENMAETHKVLLSKGIMIVEGLNLEEAPEGWHNLVCLPLKLSGVEGAPARCILTASPSYFWNKERKVIDMGEEWLPWHWDADANIA